MNDGLYLAYEQPDVVDPIEESILKRSGEKARVGDTVFDPTRSQLGFVTGTTGDVKYGAVVTVFMPEPIMRQWKDDAGKVHEDVAYPAGLKFYTPAQWKGMMKESEVNDATSRINDAIGEEFVAPEQKALPAGTFVNPTAQKGQASML
jgi:hypothetical protein